MAASPDLTILPLGLAASAYGGGAVVAALAAFAATYAGDVRRAQVVATAAGYQVRGRVAGGPRQHDHVPGPDRHELVAFAGF